MSQSSPAIFLDRDGTLIEDRGFLKDPSEIRLYHDTVDTLVSLSKKYRLFVISNQSGIGRGHITMEDAETVNRGLDAHFKNAGIRIEKWYVCPHVAEDNCQCMKPAPGFLEEAAHDFGLDLSLSFVIGDHPHDVYTGDSVGAFGLYLLSGHGSRHLNELADDRLVFHCLGDAAAWILSHPRHREDLRCAIDSGARAIRRGGLVAFPTETVYGLGANALDPEAAAAIFEAKGRPLHDPLIVHVAGEEQFRLLAADLPETAHRLVEAFWPGPLALVVKKSPAVPDIVTAGGDTVAVRMPRHPLALDLIRESGVPIAAPSANAFGRTSPTTAAHVADQLDGSYDVLIDGGACRVGVESTVLSLTTSIPTLLRPGGISREAIEEVIGEITAASAPEEGRAAESPGMLSSHYAPVTPLVLTECPEDFADDKNTGVILFSSRTTAFSGPVVVLSEKGDPREAAAHLYRAIRLLDGHGLDRIAAERLPAKGIGAVVNDRLTRAAAKR